MKPSIPAGSNKAEVEAIAHAQCLKNTVSRMRLISWATALGYGTYGFSSLGFIKHFRPETNLWENTYPRLLMTVLPLLITAFFIQSTKFSDRKKINFYLFLHSLIFFLSSSVFVWPIAVWSDPTIMLYVSGANSTFLCATWTILAIPKEFLPKAILFLTLFVLSPIYYAIFKSPELIFLTILNDTILATGVGIGCGYLLSRVHYQNELVRAEQIVNSSSFLGSQLKTAIYEGRTDLLEDRKMMAFIFFLDIRNSTALTKEFGLKWEGFNRDWIKLVSETIAKHDGYFVKSSGDGILGGFGLFDDETDLTDLTDYFKEIDIAEKVRMEELGKQCLSCLNELFSNFLELNKKHFPNHQLRLGGGIDRGLVTRGIRGGHDKKEFDIWGDCVNIAAKLEAFTKVVAQESHSSNSLLAISPYAADFVSDNSKLRIFEVNGKDIYTSFGIRWVLVREYASLNSQNPSIKAS